MRRNKLAASFILILSIFSSISFAPNTSDGTSTLYQTETNILYYSVEQAKEDDYLNERCRLDLCHPKNKSGYPTVVWFHGGGLKAGYRYIPEELKNKNIAIAAVGYRLSPKVLTPVCIEDAAAAVAWVFNNIDKYGGDTNLIYVSGHSAGGYLTSMIGLDKKWLAKFDIDADKIAGLIPFSGHAITHFTTREERGIPGEQPIIDEMAPLFHVRPNAPPLILITGDRELELLGRYEENAYLYRMMKVAGHKNTELYELQGHDHVEMVSPAHTILLKYIFRTAK
jgi:acetyl esterase/lipase